MPSGKWKSLDIGTFNLFLGVLIPFFWVHSGLQLYISLCSIIFLRSLLLRQYIAFLPFCAHALAARSHQLRFPFPSIWIFSIVRTSIFHSLVPGEFLFSSKSAFCYCCVDRYRVSCFRISIIVFACIFCFLTLGVEHILLEIEFLFYFSMNLQHTTRR